LWGEKLKLFLQPRCAGGDFSILSFSFVHWDGSGQGVFTRVDTIVHIPELGPFLSRDCCFNSGLGAVMAHDYQLIAGACVILLVLTTVKLLASI